MNSHFLGASLIMSNSSKINKLVRQVFRQQVFGYRLSNNYSSDFPVASVVLYVLKLMGINDLTILCNEPNDIKNVLILNDLTYNCVSIPGDLLTQEYNPIITYLNNSPVAIYRIGRRTLVFDGLTSQIFQLNASTCLELTGSDGYEIYPSLPVSVRSATDLFPVAFGGQLLALVSLIITSAIIAILCLGIPLFTNYLVSTVIPSGSYDELIEALFIVFLITISVIASQFLQSLMVLRLETTSDLRLQTALWDRVMKLPLSILDTLTPADIVSRVDGISKIRGLVSNGISSSIIQAMFSCIYFVLMFFFDQTLALIALLITVVYILFVFRTTVSSIAPQRRVMESEAKASEFTYQAVVGYAQIKTSMRIFNVVEQWLSSIVDSTGAQLRSNFYIDQVSIANGSVMIFSNIVIFSIPVYKALTAPDYSSIANVTAQFITFYSAYAAFFGGMLSTTSMLSVIAPQVAVLWERSNPIIHATLEPGRSSQSLKHSVMGDILIESLAYGFPAANNLLFSDLKLRIDSCSNIAITGPSGCGKTTLIRLLLGLIQPASGSIFIDGIPLNKISITHYRRQIGCVMQDIKLPPGSIGDIIKGSIVASDDEVWHALELASFADDVNSMPMKLNTIITSGGVSLSGGQRQRLCISRALLKRPKLLFLDEATSALDNQTQQRVTEVFDKLGVTRVVVAHRLSTIRYSDKIYVIKNGRVSESGSWQDLSSNPDSYISSASQAVNS